MRNLTYLFIILLAFSACKKKAAPATEETPETPATAQVMPLSFPAKDGVKISSELYLTDPKAPIILLCHQAGFNKSEYKEIAPRLNAMGFNCLAIDQRSGGEMAGGQPNETMLDAASKDLPTEFLDAELDIITAINFAKLRFQQQVILWGSSYSASLVMKIAAQNPDVKGVLAFSPGEYFGDKFKLANVVANIPVSVFVTSSKKEADKLNELVSLLNPDIIQSHFVPTGEGQHGSKALWEQHKDHAEYWEAVEKFLAPLK